MKLLFIEDDPSVRRILTRMLRLYYADIEVKVAERADEALVLLREALLDRAFDFVLSDFDLPDGTGGDVLEWIKVHASYLESRFLFLSGNPEVVDLYPHTLEKPCSAMELYVTIDTMLATAS